jgi:dTDP-glucose 4,6-dehydratase
MKILVTGGAGFIGTNFIRFWLKGHQDDRICNLDALTYAGNRASLRDVEGDSRYEFVEGDICVRELINRLFDDHAFDLVVHFAAATHVDRSIDTPEEFVRTNVIGTQVLLDAAREHGKVRFHHISTDEVFGDLPVDSDEKFSEISLYKPSSPYSASKAASDHLVHAYFRTYGLPITISNCSNNFGPYQHPEKVLPLFITNILEGKKVPLYGDGLNVRDWLYVEDHCSAIECIITRGVIGETYCVGTSNERSNIELTRLVLQLMGKDESSINRVADRMGHDRRYAIDATKLTSQLGWRARHDFQDQLQATIDWYQQNEWWWKPLKDAKDKFVQK